MIKDILIINASPRKDKNCFNISRDVSKILEREGVSCALLDIYEMDIDYCNACGYCEHKKGCRIKDDMTELYDMFDKSRGTVVVSPVYFNSVPAKMKTVVDRTQAVYSSKFVLGDSMIDRSRKRAGMYIAVGGSKEYEDQFDGVDIVMDFFFKSINSRSVKNIRIPDSDEVSYVESEELIENIKKSTEEYATHIKNIMSE